MIRKLLVANRGEIACRIVRSARSLGIATVAVYTDADAGSPHVEAADTAVRVDSYLNADSMVAAARRAGAGAIHPGYGFLAENADFAAACVAAGLVFIGPTPDVIRAMGMKDAARDVAIQANVPVVPAYEPGRFPVLIKAVAGGGGRGMRIVRSAAELEIAVASARGEAERAFGNGGLLMERFIEGARHVEVQIFGDHHGNVAHLFERDCSVQRRYQKVIEESPSPAVNPDVRARMCDAATRLGRAMGYTNAGTVEFLLAPSGEFYFIEVNTRIQVEHPVTEMVTGLDLIRMQIEVAEGRPLQVESAEQRGHSIEARLYAEDPTNGFLPSTGTLHVWRPCDVVRVDTGVREGTGVGVHYDPLLAKFIAWGEDRDRAARELAYALRASAVGGVETNRDYLVRVLESADFLEGRAHTGWTVEYQRDSSRDDEMARAAASHIARSLPRPLAGVPGWWRNSPFREPVLRLEIGGSARDVSIGSAAPYHVYPCGGDYYVHSLEAAAVVKRVGRFARNATATHESANSPMPGQVLRILVSEGQMVKAGDPLVVLEAMKMEQTVRTTIDGRIGAVLVRTGQVVAPGQMLVEIGDSTAGEKKDEHAGHSAGGD